MLDELRRFEDTIWRGKRQIIAGRCSLERRGDLGISAWTTVGGGGGRGRRR